LQYSVNRTNLIDQQWQAATANIDRRLSMLPVNNIRQTHNAMKQQK